MHIKILLMILISGVLGMTSAFGLSITSTSFPNNGPIPVDYTCDGKDMSPQLSWTGVPANAKSLVLIVSDPDAPSGTWYHWVIYNIAPTVRGIDENATPSGTQGKTSFGKTQYNGPCPPRGSIPHHYIFTLSALDRELKLPVNPPPDASMVEAFMKGHVLGSAKLTGIYKRQ